MHVHPRASAKPISRANTNFCVSEAPSIPSRTSVPVVHRTVVAGAEARYHARHQDCHGQRSRRVRCSHSDRNIICVRCAQDRFIMDLKLAIPWGPDVTGSSISTFLCSQGRQAHHFLNRRYQQIYVRRRILFRVMPARSAILGGAAKPLACQPCQPRLEWSPAWVVED